MIEQQRTEQAVSFVLSPNRSASWHQTKRFLWLLAVPVIIIAVGWSFAGVWLILPFAGLEMGLCVFLFYRVCHASYHQQQLELAPQEITVSEGFRRWRQRTLPRRGTLLEVIETENHWHLPRLHLNHAGEIITIGNFLNLEERQSLIELLAQEGIIVCRNHWWKR